MTDAAAVLDRPRKAGGPWKDWSLHVADEPTPSELYRLIDALRKDVGDLRREIGALPSAPLMEAREQRITDRLTRAEQTAAVNRADAERDLASLRATVEALQKSLEIERDTRAADVLAEEKARQKQIESEKARFGVWFRWLVGLVTMTAGAALASIFGVHIGGHG